MIPKEVKDIVKKIADDEVSILVQALLDEIKALKEKVENLNIEIQILKEGDNI